MMKKLAISLLALAALAVLLYGGVWLWYSYQAKTQYDKARQGITTTYEVTPIDQEMSAFLADVQSHWVCRANELNGTHSEGCKAAGLTPSVSNLIDIFNFQMPEYNWFSPEQNRMAAVMGLVKAYLLPISHDKNIHVSHDRHLAFIWCGINVVYVFRDDPDGLREILYFKFAPKESTEQDPVPLSQPTTRPDEVGRRGGATNQFTGIGWHPTNGCMTELTVFYTPYP